MNSGQVSTVPLSRVNGHNVHSHLDVSSTDLAVELIVESLDPTADVLDIVQEWGEQSFPASDPPANW